MSTAGTALAKAIRRAIDEAPIPRIVRIRCTSTTPFMVEINGTGSYAAQKLSGSTFALNDTGYALFQPRGPKPICFKVT